MAKIERALRLSNFNLPPRPKVERIEWWETVDSVDDPAIDVTVVLADETRDDERHWVQLKPISDAIFAAVRKVGDERFPYIRFVTNAELASEKAA